MRRARRRICMTTEQTATAAPAPSSRSGLNTGRDRRRGWLSFLRDVIIIVLVAILVSFLVKTFLVRSFYIPSGSMERHAHGQRPDPRRRDHAALRRLRARRHRRLPRSRRVASGAHRPAALADRRGRGLDALARRPVRARQRRSPRQAHHRTPGRPRRVLQHDRSDHRQRRADRRERLPQAPQRRQPGIRRRLRRRGARRSACGCWATTAIRRRTRGTTRTSPARGSFRSRTSSAARS